MLHVSARKKKKVFYLSISMATKIFTGELLAWTVM
jgi:hypothetical protein